VQVGAAGGHEGGLRHEEEEPGGGERAVQVHERREWLQAAEAPEIVAGREPEQRDEQGDHRHHGEEAVLADPGGRG
jgi:hypothetical protein